jgi:hypothetical protein
MKHLSFTALLFLAFPIFLQATPCKLLHMSFHKGCINDFAEVTQELSLDTTDWYIHDSRTKFDPEAIGNDIYNITHERAERVWKLNKEYFNEFDAIIVSDTAPLARIFLQNDWQKPLIIWICNRFDYVNNPVLVGTFPDHEYYDLFRSAINKPNVTIISYTPYEHYYAHQRGVFIGTRTIRPLGQLPKEPAAPFASAIPQTVTKSETVFIYPRMEDHAIEYVKTQCANLGIKTFSGEYNGPDDLTDFKGILYFPYQWSNLALFENIQRGIVHFIPSEQFVHKFAGREPVRYCTLDNFPLCEWYCYEYKDLFVYYNSWADLQKKINNTDYQQMREKIKKAGFDHWQKNLNAWKDVFHELSISKK